MPLKQKAIVISENPVLSLGLKTALQEGLFTEVSLFHSIEAFEKEVLHLEAEVVLIDNIEANFKLEKALALVDLIGGMLPVLFSKEITRERWKELIGIGVKGGIHFRCSLEEITEVITAVINEETTCCSCLLQLEEASVIDQLNISERELDVIKLIAEGYINKEIAERLFLSTHTVNTHRKNIMQKLGINNTAGIVLFAVKEGIVSPTDFLFQ